jgi:hypothetical protein
VFLVVSDMRQCKITLKMMSPALSQEEEEEVPLRVVCFDIRVITYSIRFCDLFYVICIYLYKLILNTISISDDVRVV